MNIKIFIEEERHYADVAAVVYREEFVQEIQRIRKALEGKIPKDYHSASHVPTKTELELIDRETEISRKNLYLPFVFKKVIEEAALVGTVSNYGYSPAYLERQSNGTFDKEGATPDDTYKIVLSPGVRDDDVIKILQKYRDQVGNYDGIPQYKYIHTVWPISRGKPSLKKHMAWFRDFKNGVSIEEIRGKQIDNCKVDHPIEVQVNQDSKKSQKKPKGCICYDISTIRKGIESYEEHIMKVPTL